MKAFYYTSVILSFLSGGIVSSLHAQSAINGQTPRGSDCDLQVSEVIAIPESRCDAQDGRLEIYLSGETTSSTYSIQYEAGKYGEQTATNLQLSEGKITLTGLKPGEYADFTITKSSDGCQVSLLNQAFFVNSSCERPMPDDGRSTGCGTGTISYTNCDNQVLTIYQANISPNTYIYVDDSYLGCVAYVNASCQIQPSVEVYCGDYVLTEPTPYQGYAYGTVTFNRVVGITTALGISELSAERINWILCNGQDLGYSDSYINQAIWHYTNNNSCNDLCNAANSAVTSVQGGIASQMVVFVPTQSGIQPFIENNCYCSGNIDNIVINDLGGGSDIILTNGATINQASLPASYNLEALVSGQFESVQFIVNGTSHTENTTPYRYPTDATTWTANVGTNTITVKVYAEDNAGGSICDEVTLSFTVTSCLTSPGTITGDESQCGSYDPANIVGSSLTSPVEYKWQYRLGTTGTWIDISSSNTRDYNPGTITQTTQYRRRARTNSSCPWVDSSPVTKTVLTNCQTVPTDWSYDCGDGVTVDEYGYNANCQSSVTIPIPNSGNVFQYAIEIVFKGGNPGPTITVTNAGGTSFTLARITPSGGSSNVWVYRGLITGTTTSVSYTVSGTSNCNLQSAVVYAFRNDPNATANSGVFTSKSGYNDIQTITIPIPTDSGPRDVSIELPISELTADGRYMLIRAQAGGQTGEIYLYGPDASLPGGTCCLAIPTVTIPNVPGSTNSVVITIDTRNGQNGQGVNGQSWVLAGLVNVETECFQCAVTVNAGNDQTVCSGTTVTITASASNGTTPYTYNWSNGLGSGASKTVTPTATTTYTVTVTDANGCTATDQVKITVIAKPVASFSKENPTCGQNNGSITFTFNNDPNQTQIEFSINNGVSYPYNVNDNTGSTTVSNLAPGTYQLWVRWGNDQCPVSLGSTTLTDQAGPSVDAGNNQTICVGGSATLEAMATGGETPYTYNWSNGLGSGKTKTVSPTSTTTYTVTVTDKNGCTATDQVTVTVNPNPDIVCESNINDGGWIVETDCSVAVCVGTKVMLSVNPNGASLYQWSGPNGFSFSSTSTSDILVSNSVTSLQAGTYHVTVTNSFGCTATGSIALIVHPNPTASITGDNNICVGESTTLTASATGGSTPYTFNWSNGLGSGAVKTVSPTMTTTYTVTVSDNKGCTDTEQRTVTVNPNPTITINTKECNPLNLFSTYTVTLTVTNADEVTSSAGLVSNTGGNNYTIANIPSGTNITVTATNTFTGCQKQIMVEAPSCLCPNVNPPTSQGNQTICADENIPALVVTVSNPTHTVDWYDAAGGGNLLLANSLSYTPTVAGTYYAEARSTVSGCVSDSRTPVTLTINPLPNANAGNDVSICVSGSTTLTATGGSIYAWSNGQNTPSIMVSPLTTTTYTVTVTDSNGCEDTDQVIVTVNNNPDVNAGNDVTICEGTSTTLQASATGGNGNYTYEWSNGLGSNPTQMVAPMATTTYSVTVTDGNGCTDTDQVIVTVNDSPDVNAGNDVTICEGTSTTLQASATGGNGSYTFSWSNGLGTGAIKTVSPMTTTIYSVTVTDVNNCTDVDDVIVTVNDTPEANAGDDVTICEGESTTLTASGNGGTTPYTYNWSNGLGTNQSITVSPAITNTYTVTVTDANNCFDTDQVTVFVTPDFTSGISAPTSRCAEEPVLFIADPAVSGATYSWTFSGPATPSSANTASVSVEWANIPGIYTATLTVTKGACVEVYTHDINITQAVFAAAGEDQTICQGASTVIGGNPTGPANANFLWSPNFFISGITAANPTVNPPVTTTYTVQVSQNGCVRTESVTVFVDVELNPKPEAGPDQTICVGENISIGGAADPNAIFYQWSTINGNINGANSNFLTVSPTVTTKYYVTAYNAQGCPGVDSVIVNVNPTPLANAGNDAEICFGEMSNLSASASGGTAPYTFAWSNGLGAGADKVVAPSVTTTYTVTVTDANGCTDTDEVTITVNPLPAVNAGNDVAICFGQSLNLTAQGSGGQPPYAYSWDNGSMDASIMVNPTLTTTYIVEITDANGCTSSDEVTVTVNPNPQVTVDGTDATCGFANGSATAIGSQGTPPYSYSWAGGQTTATIDDLLAGTYFVTLTDANGCTATGSVTIDNIGGPSVTVDPVAVCAGSPATLTADVSGGTAPFTYLWNTNETSASITVNPLTTTNYSVTVTDVNGCEAITQVTVTAYPLPSVDAGDDEAVCLGESVDLEAMASGGTAPYTYLWSNNEVSSTLTVSPTQTTTYFVTVTDVNGCQDTDEVTVTIFDLPVADATPDQTVCDGTTLTLNVSGVNGLPPYAFIWSTGDVGTSTTITATQTDNYFVTVTDGNGCTDVDVVMITVLPNPTADAGADAEICFGSSTTITASANGGQAPYTYMWNQGLGAGASHQVSPTVTTTY
ncbi:MAG TPA: hypothetical protein PKA00_19325, partial [Saprospiraceae bacterium]|nr:hypothetical protein [Saprospiraceae bacterium]HMQ85070.1 hypothetical protein [Saprospiraceae bacterium]